MLIIMMLLNLFAIIGVGWLAVSIIEQCRKANHTFYNIHEDIKKHRYLLGIKFMHLKAEQGILTDQTFEKLKWLFWSE